MKLFEQIGIAITSMAAVIFVLVLTLLGLLTFTHTLFYDVLPQTITGWERYAASWLLALGWEFTLLITTVNTQLLNRRIPVLAAIASGVIVLFFIEAFEFDQPIIELLKRWFIGLLVATINFIYTELFYVKWSRLQKERNLEERIAELEQTVNSQSNELDATKDHLTKANTDVERLVDYVAELEVFKRKAVAEKSCRFCGTELPSVYHVHSHMRNCDSNPRKGEKLSVFEAVG